MMVETDYKDSDGNECVRIEGLVPHVFQRLQEYFSLCMNWRIHDDPRKMVTPRGLCSVVVTRQIQNPASDQPSPEIPDKGPYTHKQLTVLPWDELKRRAKEEYNLTHRSRGELVKRILKHQAQGDKQ